MGHMAKIASASPGWTGKGNLNGLFSSLQLRITKEGTLAKSMSNTTNDGAEENHMNCIC